MFVMKKILSHIQYNHNEYLHEQTVYEPLSYYYQWILCYIDHKRISHYIMDGFNMIL